MVALVVEDGSGKTDANAYCSVAFADAYHAAHVQGSAWDLVADKEAAIATATMVLDNEVDWNGSKWNDDQALAWPRTGCHDKEGDLIDSDVLPKQVARATAELARLLAAEDLTADAAEKGISEIKLGEMTLKFDPMDRKGVLPDSVRAHLRGLAVTTEPYGSVKAIRG